MAAATAEDVIVTLRSIDASLKLLVSHLGAGARQATQTEHAGTASEADLDGKYGNEKIKFDPRDWTGDSFKGKLMSEAQPGYLDLLASAYDFFAEKNDRTKEVTDKGVAKSTYDRRTAARARGWAARLREGWTAPVAPAFGEPEAPLTSDSIPF